MRTKINISSSTTDGPAIPGYLYTPPDGTTVQGCVLCLPGSGGGVGPGIAVHPQLFADVDKRGCHGGLYMRLGQELSTGHTVDWQSRRKPNPSTTNTKPRFKPPNPATGKPKPKRGGTAVLQIDWTIIPRKRLRRMDMMSSAVGDAEAAANYLLATFPGVPLVVCGFSFGGPVMWAMTKKLSDCATVVGVASIAGSARGGTQYEESEFGATADNVAAFRRRGAILFLHGTHDKNVALQVAEHLYDRAASVGGSDDNTLLMVRVRGAKHMFESFYRDAAYKELKAWVVAALKRGRGTVACVAKGGVCLESKGGAKEVAVRAMPKKGVIVVGGMNRKKKSVVGGKGGRGGRGRGGNETWRVKPSKKRMKKIGLLGSDHPLAGLVGYSE